MESTNKQIDVSIIIVNYKTPLLCCACIHSMEKCSAGFSYEIIVIDNDSKDDSEKIIKKEFGDRVFFFKNNEK